MKTIFAATLILAMLGVSTPAAAQLTGNVGWASEYHFRGILQKTSSASAGLDYGNSGFYAGTWAADVGDGLEVDGYFGYGGEVEDFSYSIGYTGYFYTGDFDDTYQEVNLGGGYGPLTVDVALGRYDNFTGPTLDYTYYAIGLAGGGFYGKYGGFSEDFDGNYLEFGYGTTLSGVDVGVVLILADDDLIGDEDESLLLTVGKTFDLN